MMAMDQAILKLSWARMRQAEEMTTMESTPGGACQWGGVG